jgi:hypothetical protein
MAGGAEKMAVGPRRTLFRKTLPELSAIPCICRIGLENPEHRLKHN